MLIWEQAVDVLRESVMAYTQACNGNLGAGILAVTFLARLALLPLGIRLAKSAAQQQAAMARLKPTLDALRATHATNAQRLAEETRKLFAREGVSPVPVGGCLGAVAQAPVFIALYSAVRQAAQVGGRFLWVRDLARPDWPLVLLAAGVTLFASAPTGAVPPEQRTIMQGVSGLVAVFALSKMAAGVALYWAVSSAFGVVQGRLVQRGLRHNAV